MWLLMKFKDIVSIDLLSSDLLDSFCKESKKKSVCDVFFLQEVSRTFCRQMPREEEFQGEKGSAV